MIQKISDWNGTVVPGDPQAGDIVRVTEPGGHVSEYRYYPPPTPASPPAPTLSKTAFMDVATAALGGGQAGRARFLEIIEAARDFAGSTAAAREVRFVFERYAAATSFNKTNVQALTTILQAAGIMSAGEAAALIAAWPAA